MNEMVTVVSAAIVDVEAKLVLLAQRSGSTSYPWCWCTPGGKVEACELLLQALKRELREEIGVTINVFATDRLYEHELPSSRTGQMVKVICYVIPSTEVTGTYMCGDKTVGIGWFDASDLATRKLAPADDAHRGDLIRLSRGVICEAQGLV